jgi:threonine/homoserine efflux transporter RhtA
VGVELGQLLVLCIVVPLLVIMFRYLVAERMGVIILSALVAHSAWHWMAERWAVLMAYEISLPVLNSAFYSSLAQWGVLLIVAIATLWVMQNLFGRFFAPDAVSRDLAGS